MKRQYNVEENGVIWYEENGVRVSFMPDFANSDYQAYLNKDNPDWGKGTISQEYELPLKAVMKAARDEIGYQEGANNDNKFAKVAGHANNQPWCATFIRACFIKGKEEKAIPDTAYCPYLESWGRQHNRIVPIKELKRGDLLLFDFGRTGRADHVGIATHDFDEKSPLLVKTIEGNTGNKSQTNGEFVARKNRAVSLVRVIVRPKWSKE